MKDIQSITVDDIVTDNKQSEQNQANKAFVEYFVTMRGKHLIRIGENWTDITSFPNEVRAALCRGVVSAKGALGWFEKKLEGAQ